MGNNICMKFQNKIYFLEMLIHLLQSEYTKIILLRRIRASNRRNDKVQD